MKIVALDSSGMTASVAIASPDLVIAEYSVTYKKTHSQTLVPMLDEICRMAQLSPDEIEAIAVAGGPGSFTGLRIGSATAKGLALAWNKPILSVPTLEGLACRYIGTDRLVCPMMDARREQVYTGLYRFADKKPGYTGLQIIYEQDALPVEEILETINETGERVQFLGDGVKVYAETIQNMTKVD